MKAILVAALALAGCGGGADDWAQPLDGSWVRILSPACGMGLNIDVASRTYSLHFMCELAGAINQFGDSLESGDVELAQKNMRFIPKRVSCPADGAHPEVFDYSVRADSLALSTPDGILAFARGKPAGMIDGAGLGLVYGCWYEDGTFVTHELVNL